MSHVSQISYVSSADRLETYILRQEAATVATTTTQPALELHDAPARHQERRPTIYVACAKCGAQIPQKKGLACGWCGRKQK